MKKQNGRGTPKKPGKEIDLGKLTFAVNVSPGLHRDITVRTRRNSITVHMSRARFKRASSKADELGYGDVAEYLSAVLVHRITHDSEPFPVRPIFANPKIEERAREIDSTLCLLRGHGVTESFVQGIITDVKGGDFGAIIGGWDFDGGEKAAVKKLRKLANKWNAEDAGGKEAA